MDNRVEIIVGAKDDTKFDLDALKARLTDLGKKVETARVKVDDADAEIKIARMQAKLVSLGKRVASPKIEVGGVARAYADILLMNHELDKMGGSGAGRAAGGLLGAVTSGFSSLAPALASSGTLLAVAAAAAVALGLALTPVLAALIPITLGFGAFAAAIAVLPGVQKKAKQDMGDLKDEFHKLAEQVKPELLKAFAEGMKIIKALMPSLEPLMKAAGKAVDAFLHQLLDWIKSPSGQAFLKWLRVDGPRDIKLFGRIMWDTAYAIGVALDHIFRAADWLYNYFGHKFIPNLKEIWGNLVQWIWHDFVGKIITFFGSTIPAVLDILKERWRVVFDTMELKAFSMVHGVLDAMSHIPFVGHYFKQAADDVDREMRRMQGDVRQAEGNIQADLDRIHGKNVNLNFQMVSDVTSAKRGLPGFASGTSGAGPGWAWVGERGPELVKMRGGETVIPNHMLKGYANGVFNFSDSFHPSVATFGHRLISAADSILVAMARAAQRILSRQVAGGVGGVAGNVQSYGPDVIRVLRMLGQPTADTGVVLRQMQTESGGNPTVVNKWDSNWARGTPSVGLMQVIGPTFAAYAGPYRNVGPFEYGVSVNPMANIFAGLNYAVHRYGAAWTRVLGQGHGYDHGGYLPTGWSMAYNGTGRPEPVGAAAKPTVIIQVGTGGGALDLALLNWLKRAVRVQGGGDVQVAFGTRG